MKNLSAVLFILFSVSIFNLEAKALDTTSKFEGNWAYECYDAPYPYHEGTLLIAEKENETTVKVVFKNGQSISGRNVAIKDGNLSFDIYVEGNVVKTTLEQKGEGLTGKAHSPEGIMELVVKKKAKE